MIKYSQKVYQNSTVAGSPIVDSIRPLINPEGGSPHPSNWTMAIDVNCLNWGLNSVKRVQSSLFLKEYTASTPIIWFSSEFQPNRRSNLSNVGFFCSMICNSL
jgi:hypothetical protein